MHWQLTWPVYSLHHHEQWGFIITFSFLTKYLIFKFQYSPDQMTTKPSERLEHEVNQISEKQTKINAASLISSNLI